MKQQSKSGLPIGSKSVRYLSYFLAFHALHDSVVLPSVMYNIVSQITKGPCPFYHLSTYVCYHANSIFSFKVRVSQKSRDFQLTSDYTALGLVGDVFRSVD